MREGIPLCACVQTQTYRSPQKRQDMSSRPVIAMARPYNVCGLTCCVYPRKKKNDTGTLHVFLPELHHRIQSPHTHSPSQFLLEECRSLFSQFSWKVVPPFPYCHKGETAPGKFLPLLTFHGITSSSSSSSLVSPDERWGGGREGGRKNFPLCISEKTAEKGESGKRESSLSLWPKTFFGISYEQFLRSLFFHLGLLLRCGWVGGR